MKFNVAKTQYGFEYSLGQLVIARGQWVKSDGEWKLRLFHLTPTGTTFGIASCFSVIVEVKDVFPYLNELMFSPPPPTKEDIT